MRRGSSMIFGIVLLAVTGCGFWQTTCPRPADRYALGYARIATADSTFADAYVGVQETRGGPQQIYVHVQSYPLIPGVTQAPRLAGHVLRARLSTAGGHFLLDLPLQVAPQASSEIGSSPIMNVPSDLYFTTRDALLRGSLVVTLQTDSTVETLLPGAVTHVQSHDWEKVCGD